MLKNSSRTTVVCKYESFKAFGWIILLVAFVSMFLSMTGCGNPRSFVEPIAYANRGGWSPQTRFSVFAWAIRMDIKKEIAGGAPQEGCRSWREYWQQRYREIQHSNDLNYSKSRLIYIYQERQRVGLPLYVGDE